MASTGIIQRRYLKHELIASPPLVGEVVFALDTEEFGTLINGDIVWKKFDDIIKSVNGKIGHVIITKEELGLGNVDNTSDVDKPVSTATEILFDTHTSNTSNPHNITKAQLSLENVDNTSDADKPLSNADITALADKLGKLETAKDSERLGGFTPDYYANVGDSYTKPETDDLLNNKANLGDVYTRLILDAMFNDKANVSDVYSKTDADSTFEIKSNKGVANGYPSLGTDGKVPLSQLPSATTAKEVFTYDSNLDFPSVGEADTIYISNASKNIYEFDVSTTQYVPISVGLGDLETTAYRGDRGKIGYEHTLLTNNPHHVTTTQIDAYTTTEVNSMRDNHLAAINPHNITPELLNVYTKDKLDNHEADYNNPHEVTASQVGAYTKAESDSLASGNVQYLRSYPMLNKVGGLPAGSTFDGNINDALDRLFYPEDFLSFESFSIDGITSPRALSNGITAGPYIARWTINKSDEVKVNSVTITHGTDVLGNDLANIAGVNTAQITIPSDILSSEEKWEEFKITALDTNDNPFSLFYSIKWVTSIPTYGPMFYGVWEYDTPPLTNTQLNSVDFIKVTDQSNVDGTYTFNAKAYDSTDPDYVAGSNNGNGAYHTIVYPASWPAIQHMVDLSNSIEAAWVEDDPITINGKDYRVARTTNQQYAGNYTYKVS
jgi:hypothetical protein